MRVGAIEDQRLRPLGIGGGEEHAHGAAFRNAEKCRAPAVDGVHDGAHIVHPLLQRGEVADPVGETGATLVEKDETAESAQAGDEVNEIGFIPIMIEVGDEAWHEDKIERPFADHLIGDPKITALGIMGLHHRAQHSR